MIAPLVDFFVNKNENFRSFRLLVGIIQSQWNYCCSFNLFSLVMFQHAFNCTSIFSVKLIHLANICNENSNEFLILIEFSFINWRIIFLCSVDEHNIITKKKIIWFCGNRFVWRLTKRWLLTTQCPMVMWTTHKRFDVYDNDKNEQKRNIVYVHVTTLLAPRSLFSLTLWCVRSEFNMAAHRFETPTSTIDNGIRRTTDKERTKILGSLNSERSNKPFTNAAVSMERDKRISPDAANMREVGRNYTPNTLLFVLQASFSPFAIFL